MSTDHRSLLATLEEYGFDLRRGRNSHWRIRGAKPCADEDCLHVTSAATTPSDNRATKNLRAWARRHGLPR